MKAAYYDQYGPPDVFRIESIPKPVLASDEVLVRVICTTVNRTDTGMTSAIYFVSRLFTGIFKPSKNVPGTDFAGIIEAIGDEVEIYKVGDEVFGFNDQVLSSQAEYMKIKANGNLLLKPENVGFEEAAASIEGAHYAINICRYIHVKKGDHVMVNGATGGIGSAAVQLLKSFGANIVATANTPNIELVKNLGANKVIDYLKADFTQTEDRFDYVVDAVGKSSYKACKKILKPKGIYVSSELGENGANIWLALASFFKSGKKVKFPVPSGVKESLRIVQGLLEKGEFHPVIDRKYELEEVVDAYKYVASGQKTGNVILSIQRP